MTVSQGKTNDAGLVDVAQQRFVVMEKDFLGSDAMLERKPSRLIAPLISEGADTDALIGKAVLIEGQYVGSIISVGFDHIVGKLLTIALLDR